ncbi:ABC transporter permease [Sinorhizobium medicae]|uniref:ABC transporter permease n=1 Tax=Sinorhizobium medicae TaxID=110321 RepID=UPI00036ABC12|nr:ABC transporter permease [Sinorhizobium medicae]WQO45419.1 ABC transporter permease [Sinorhizobium medicae]WQO65581.1 ABC transporter permease [Sinorhizobium medicae]WQO72709.1 ABC transporter permease [Sinorhizobium medicae]WQO92018.1 ABC transporter permease [Sinorhizobium medicae]
MTDSVAIHLRPRTLWISRAQRRGTAGILAVLLLWQISVWIIDLPPYFYPAPRDVLAAFGELIRNGILIEYLADSSWRYAVSVGTGLSLGIIFGLLIGLSGFWSRPLGSIIRFFYAIVEVAWIPLLVIWIGYGFPTILIAISYVVFFPVLYNTLTGVQTIQPVLINAVRTLGASRFQVLTSVILPAALPNIMTGLRVGAGFAFRGLIFAEMIAAGSGLGFLIFDGASTRQTDRVVVGMIMMGLLWLLMDRLLLRPIERATIERWGLVRAQGGES